MLSRKTQTSSLLLRRSSPTLHSEKMGYPDRFLEKSVKVLPFLGFGFFGYNAYLQVITNSEPLESCFSIAVFATFVVSVGSVMRAQSLTEKQRRASLPVLVALFLVIAAGFLVRAWVVLPPTFRWVVLPASLLPASAALSFVFIRWRLLAAAPRF